MGKRSKSKHSHRTGLCKQSKPERMSLILRTRHPELRPWQMLSSRRTARRTNRPLPQTINGSVDPGVRKNPRILTRVPHWKPASNSRGKQGLK